MKKSSVTLLRHRLYSHTRHNLGIPICMHWQCRSGAASATHNSATPSRKKSEREKSWGVAHSATSTTSTANPHNLELTQRDCEDIMRSKLDRKDFQVRNFKLRYFVEMLGFHGNYAGLEIDCIVEQKPKEYRFFVKTFANNPVIKETYWDVLKQPYKEFVFMTKIHKELQSFVRKLITAKCHLGRLEEVMVTDDCCSMGYSRMRRGYLDIHHARAGISALANLHAASVIYQEKTGSCIQEKYRDIDYESLLSEHEDKPKAFLLHSVDSGVRQMAAAFFTETVPRETLDEMLSRIRERVVELHQNHPKNFVKVLCHGDPTAGANMLFRYTDSGAATDCILVDFGIVRFAPAAMEVMHFLHINSTDEFRRTNESHLKDAYYEDLSRICEQSGVVLSRVLSRDQFDDSCSHYEEWGTCVRVYYEYVIRLPAEQLHQVVTSLDAFLNLMVYGNAELGLQAFPKDEAYRRAIREAMESAMRFYGYIK